MVNRYYQTNTEKLQKKHLISNKIFLQKKRKKQKRRPRTDIKISL